MRELKFRMWDTFNNDWIEAVLDATTNHVNDWFRRKNIIFQQYTGLKDKNSVEIYEGDILKIFNHSQPEQVEYEPNGSGFGFFKYDNLDRKDGSFEFLSHWTGSDGYEVIGNIFENPELLNS